MTSAQSGEPASSSVLLRQYEAERSQQVQRLYQLLADDPRVQAAWLLGSLGRGQGDVLSDIDVRVVVEDAFTSEIITTRRACASLVGPVILFLEAPQNAPEGGAYLMACYAAPAAPHIIDWQWQPRAGAVIPPNARVLFNRGEAAISAETPPQRYQTVEKAVDRHPQHIISYFWMMLMIAAKYVYRSPWADEVELLPTVLAPLFEVQRYLGDPPGMQSSETPPAPTPADKMRQLRDLTGRMQALMARVAERGQDVPWAVVPGVFQYLEMVESALHERKPND